MNESGKKTSENVQVVLQRALNPAELDKSLFAGIIYAKRIDNSATVTNLISGFKTH
jgi:hypothetical protein